MNIVRGLRSRFLLRNSRYAEALACYRDDADIAPADARWAYYRLGCYRTALRFGHSPEQGRDALAIGVSMAACGQLSDADAVLRRVTSLGLFSPRLRKETARALAQYSPDLAWELIDGHVVSAGLQAALCLARDDREKAAALLQDASDRGDIRDPDIHLLRANLADDRSVVLEQFNAYLAAHGVSPVTSVSTDAPLAVGNLRATVAAGSMRGPLVTVTMPAYNMSGRIEAAIGSLLGQTYRDIEVLVADDCSTDDTVSVVRRLTAADPRVRLIERSVNGGPYAARNQMLAAARGEFVTCHDADDWAHPEKIARQVMPLLNDPRLSMTLSNWVRLQDDGVFYARQVYPLTRLNPASPMFRRVVTLEKAGFYEQVRTGADSEYIARLKLVFGRRGWLRLAMPLAFGAHRAGSLMTDAATGTQRGEAMNAERLDYWEAWTQRHVAALRGRASFYREQPIG